MNKKCHWSVAGYLMQDQPWRLRGLSFKIGSIMPDILLYTYWKGHKYDTTAARVEEKLIRLRETGTWTVWSCFRMGYNLHFLEDYFTYPHNRNFDGGFIAHCWYEHRLSRAMSAYLRQHRTVAPLREPIPSIHAVLRQNHLDYMNTEPTPENDCAYILAASAAVTHWLFAAFNEQAESKRAVAFASRVGVNL